MLRNLSDLPRFYRLNWIRELDGQVEGARGLPLRCKGTVLPMLDECTALSLVGLYLKVLLGAAQKMRQFPQLSRFIRILFANKRFN